MLYALFMFWIVASISVVVASMVLGGLLCVWCAFIGRRRSRRDAASLLVHSSPEATRCPISLMQPFSLFQIVMQLAAKVLCVGPE